MIKSAFILLIAGMGTTFIFLIIQAFITNGMKFLLHPFANLIQEPAPKKAPAKVAPKADDGAVVAAIAAVMHHNS